MRVSERYFKKGGEIDITSNYPSPAASRKGRYTLRASPGHKGVYELYVYWFDTREEEVQYIGGLEQMVRYMNQYRIEMLGKDYVPDVYEPDD